MKIYLNKTFFKEKESKFLENSGLSAYVYKYDTGIEAIRLENKLGHIIVLPYQGQVIWDAVFYDRSLKMTTPFSIPQNSHIFGETYGCYLMHCGMTSMGVPKDTDNHPVHGHLPFASMKESHIEIGEDKSGKYLELFSTYERNIAFDEHYIAIPSIRLYENSSMLRVHMHTQNLSRKKMNLMYLCHINNKLIPGAKIYQTLDWDNKHMAIQDLPVSPNSDLVHLHEKVGKDPSASNPITESEFYDPEICFFLRDMKNDANHFAHYLYELPDGSGDYTYFDSKVLNHGVRWIAYHQDCQSMGMVLPGTAESEGYTKELSKNNLKYLEPMDTFDATVYCGAVNSSEAKNIIKTINEIMS